MNWDDLGIDQDPRTPAEFYHNARVQELSGRFAQAFADYEKYVASNQSFVDPLLSYLQLLRSQQGNEAAVEMFASLRKRFPENLAIEFVSLRLLSGDRRLSGLEEFVTRHTDFLPAILDIADHFSSTKMPGRTSVDAEHERDQLRVFIRSVESGDFERFYLDKNLAAKLLDDARGRLLTQESPVSERVSKQKLFLWDGGIWVMDPAVVSISCSFDGLDWKPVPNLVRTMVLSRGAIPDKRFGDETHRRILAKYKDQKGQDSQIYELRYEDDDARAIREKLPPPMTVTMPRIPPRPNIIIPQFSREKRNKPAPPIVLPSFPQFTPPEIHESSRNK